jgi:hypothetical protein
MPLAVERANGRNIGLFVLTAGTATKAPPDIRCPKTRMQWRLRNSVLLRSLPSQATGTTGMTGRATHEILWRADTLEKNDSFDHGDKHAVQAQSPAPDGLGRHDA